MNYSVVEFLSSGNNYLLFQTINNSLMNIVTRVGGVSTSSPVWSADEVVAGNTLLVELEYSSTEFTLKIDGVLKATATPAAGIDFGANIPGVAYIGMWSSGAYQNDAVFSAP